MRRISMAIAACLFAFAAHAVSIEPPLEDASQEATAQRVIDQLRCVVCEGQSLADSDASFAREMRAEIRRLASTGQEEATIIAYFRNQYGDAILLSPPFEGDTILLWLGPLLLVILGSVLVWTSTKRRNV